MGPLDISPIQVQNLGNKFTEFVNRLLEREVSASGLDGHLLTINYNESIPDGGVDAVLREATKTEWLPEGESAWQFKRSDLGPSACADEFARAVRVHEILKRGGTYVLVLGKALPDNLIERRRAKVVEKAVELGLLSASDEGQIRVYDATKLSRWVSTFPSLAVSRLVDGPGFDAVDFETWTLGRGHDAEWIADDDRIRMINEIRSQITSGKIREIRVQGVSGAGKTRLVMEALRESEFRTLVVYGHDESTVSGDLLAHLRAPNRVAILVVDNCSADRHSKLAERLPTDSATTLITIGGVSSVPLRCPILQVGPMPDSDLEKFLGHNFPSLSVEARRFIVAQCEGNVGMAILFALRVSNLPEAQAADLIERGDIDQFVSSILPEGQDFFLATILALLERVGWEREVRGELEILASFATTSVLEMDRIGAELEQRGLLTRQGRFRALSPHPLAVFLAANAWRRLAGKIVGQLLPSLTDEMALSLFQRAADLGRFEPARTPLAMLLAADGPFSTLQEIENRGFGRLLTQLAIVLPDEVAAHIGELVEAASNEELASLIGLRRDLVWTLEKLVWNTRTFEVAADALMRLALAENETYANNATSTWVSLFGTMLPGTAATPKQRIDYLKRVALNSDPDVRHLAVKGATRGLIAYESILVSGEIQGGVLVEPRGTPITHGDVAEYRRQVISLLRELVDDSNIPVGIAASHAIVGALHPLITDRFVGEFLAETCLGLRDYALNELRNEVAGLISLRTHHGSGDPDVLAALESLRARLPQPSVMEELRVLLNQRRWDLGDGELLSQIRESIRGLWPGERESALAVLSEELPAAWEFGHGLAKVVGHDDEILTRLVRSFSVNSPALTGYLHGLTESGFLEAFDDFIERGQTDSLSNFDKVALSVRGPTTDRSKTRVLRGLDDLTVAQGTNVLFGWQRNLSETEVQILVDGWLQRLASQQDYSSLVDWFNMWLHGRESVPDSLRQSAICILLERRKFPNIGQQLWDWCRVALLLGTTEALRLLVLILDLIETGVAMIHPGDEEALLLTGWAKSFPEEMWRQITERLGAGAWSLQMQIRGWLVESFPVGTVTEWIGSDLIRARIVADIASAGEDTPSDLARFLLDKFGNDDHVASSLAGEFWSGMWTGPQSDRIKHQISQLNCWRHDLSQPLGVRTWAAKLIESLERSLQATLEREAERSF